MSNLFINATRNGYTWASSKGLLNVIDLWSLPLKVNGTNPSLDSVGKLLVQQMKEEETTSLVDTKTSVSTVMDEKLEIIKFIIAVKKKEIEEKEQAVVEKQRRESIQRLIAEKKDDALKNLSIEELQNLLNDKQK